VAVNLAFFPMHFLGNQGMPRRSPDYPDPFWGWNLVSSAGAYAAGASFLLFLWIVWRTLRAGERVAPNPWGAGATTLEWQVSSPPAALPRLRGAAAGAVTIMAAILPTCGAALPAAAPGGGADHRR
jgi:heme/copper-type cytochrome/quinol oxidase subunit 1